LTGNFSTTFRVGRKYWCTVTYPATDDADGIGALAMQWSPRPPRRLTNSEFRDYRRGRDAMLAEAARLLGARWP